MFTKSLRKKPPVIDGNYQVLKLEIEKSRILEEIFSEKFELKLNYKPEKLVDFTEVKEGLIRNFPNLERGVNLLQKHFSQTDQMSSILLRDSFKSESFALERFINMIQRRINEHIDEFNEKVINNKKFQGKKEEVPDHLNFKAFRKKIKEKIISYSNDIIRAFAAKNNRPSKLRNEKDFITSGEKIIRLYNFLKCDETAITQHASVSSGLLLHSICAKITRPVMEYISFNTKELKEALDRDMEKMYPIFMSKKEIVIRRLHDVIKDNDEIADLDYEFIARSIFHRDQKKLFREIYGKIEKALAELEFEGQNEFIVRQEGLKANIERSKIQIEQISSNEFFEGIRTGNIVPDTIRNLEFSEQSLKFIVAFEKFILDLQKITVLIKDLMEQVLFFRQEEELYYKTKFFKVMRHIIEIMNAEREKHSLDHLVENLFKKLKKTIERQDEVEDEDEEIESKLMEELIKGKNNPFLKNAFTQMQENELARKRGQHKIKEDERKYNRKEYENQIKMLLEDYDSDKDKKKRKKHKARGSSSDSDKEKKEKRKKDIIDMLSQTNKKFGDHPEYKVDYENEHRKIKKKKNHLDSSDDDTKRFKEKYWEKEDELRKRREKEEGEQNKKIEKLMKKLKNSSSSNERGKKAKRGSSSDDDDHKKKKKKRGHSSSSSSPKDRKHGGRRNRSSSSSSKQRSHKKDRHSSSDSKDKKKSKNSKKLLKSQNLNANANLTYSSDSSKARSKSKKKAKDKKKKGRSSSSSDKKKRGKSSSSSDKKKKRRKDSSSSDKKKRGRSSSSDKKKKRGSSSSDKKRRSSSSVDKKKKKNKNHSSSEKKRKKSSSSDKKKGRNRSSSSSDKGKKRKKSDEKKKLMKTVDLSKKTKKSDSSSDKKKKKKRSSSSSSEKKKHKSKSHSSSSDKKKKKEISSSDDMKKNKKMLEQLGVGKNQPDYKLTDAGQMVVSNKLNFDKPNAFKKDDSSSDEKKKNKFKKASSSEEEKMKIKAVQQPVTNPLMVTSSGAVIRNNKIDFSGGFNNKTKDSSSDEDKKKKMIKALKSSSDEDKKKNKKKLSSDEDKKKNKKKDSSSDEDKKKKKKLSSDEDKKKKKLSSDEDKKKKNFKLDSDEDDYKKQKAKFSDEDFDLGLKDVSKPATTLMNQNKNKDFKVDSSSDEKNKKKMSNSDDEMDFGFNTKKSSVQDSGRSAQLGMPPSHQKPQKFAGKDSDSDEFGFGKDVNTKNPLHMNKPPELGGGAGIRGISAKVDESLSMSAKKPPLGLTKPLAQGGDSDDDEFGFPKKDSKRVSGAMVSSGGAKGKSNKGSDDDIGGLGMKKESSMEFSKKDSPSSKIAAPVNMGGNKGGYNNLDLDEDDFDFGANLKKKDSFSDLGKKNDNSNLIVKEPIKQIAKNDFDDDDEFDFGMGGGGGMGKQPSAAGLNKPPIFKGKASDDEEENYGYTGKKSNLNTSGKAADERNSEEPQEEIYEEDFDDNDGLDDLIHSGKGHSGLKKSDIPQIQTKNLVGSGSVKPGITQPAKETSKFDEAEDLDDDFGDDHNVLDDLIMDQGKGPGPEKKQVTPIGGQKRVDDESIDEYGQDDFEELEESSPVKLKSDLHGKASKKHEDELEELEELGEDIDDTAKNNLFKSAADYKLTNTYISKTKLAKEKLDFSPAENPEFFGFFMEEFLSQHKAFFYDYEETQYLVELTFKALEEGGFDAVENEFQQVGQMIQEKYASVTQLDQFAPTCRIFFPFEIPELDFVYLMETNPRAKVVLIYIDKEFPQDEQTSMVLNGLMETIKEVMNAMGQNFDESQMAVISLEPSALKALDKYKSNKYLKYLASTYYVLYEREEIDHIQEPKLDFDESLLARISNINVSTNVVYKLIQENMDGFQAFFEKLSAKHHASKKCDVILKSFTLEQEKEIKAEIKKAIETANKRNEKSLVCIELVMGEMKASYYMVFRPLAGRKGKAEIILFLIDSYEEEFNAVIIGCVEEAKGESEFEFKIDFSRHNSLFEYNKISLGCWTSLVMEKNLDPVEAFKLISYSLIPYNCEYTGK